MGRQITGVGEADEVVKHRWTHSRMGGLGEWRRRAAAGKGRLREGKQAAGSGWSCRCVSLCQIEELMAALVRTG
ncbi:hypothetical protein E2C01_073303 [Portunus trituberculatus]|uniref:Uncharacterized protein n=1 Tax=Portunus trituberculatus TaxID=210409 RepID=A0A5B7I9G9_PORTR|nr:hypothetical protein [Portunus trituberculatus]